MFHFPHTGSKTSHNIMKAFGDVGKGVEHIFDKTADSFVSVSTAPFKAATDVSKNVFSGPGSMVLIIGGLVALVVLTKR